MGLKFGKGSVTILPGVKISLNKSGPSITIGKKGAKLTLGGSGARVSGSVPGTGISYSKKLGGKKTGKM